MTIKVCVGSSCHLKGSYEVIEAFKEVLKKYDVEDVIELQASFCLGHCAQGVTVGCEGLEAAEHGPQVEETTDGFILHSVNAGNVEELFAKEIYPKTTTNKEPCPNIWNSKLYSAKTATAVCVNVR